MRGLLLAIVAGCAHQADRAPAMVRYEASQEAQESEIIRERNPELYNAAEVEHANAIKAERAEEYEATAHHAEVAVLLWRTAEARSHTVDAEARQATAERRYAAGEAALEAARAERDEETLAIARLQEIIKLQKEMDAAAKKYAALKETAPAEALHHLETVVLLADPVLPVGLLPAGWPGEQLRHSYADFAALMVARRGPAGALMEVR